LHCQQCLGFWAGLFFGTVLFGLLWGVLFALLVSLLSVWNDFGLLALSRVGTARPPQQMTWMSPPMDQGINIDPAILEKVKEREGQQETVV
jgi:hypothetical protein